jgi:phenylpyruvate tautomerase PptA (4-oxalocrotonate tautomerase family)
MAQFKIYGYAAALRPRRAAMSDVIHAAAAATLGLPADKRFHRFLLLEDDDFVVPDSRSRDYTIIEVMLFEGRTIETKKAFVRDLYARFEEQLRIAPIDLEIVLQESPRHDWGIRGLPGDELTDLTYEVTI